MTAPPASATSSSATGADRPGLGASDPVPSRPFAFACAAAGEASDVTIVAGSRIPRARRHTLEDAGGAILWTHGAEILRAVGQIPESERSRA